MAIEYRITLDDQHQLNYRIELERHYDYEMLPATYLIDAAGGIRLAQAEDRVAGAARLESTDLLQVFALEKDFGAAEVVEVA